MNKKYNFNVKNLNPEKNFYIYDITTMLEPKNNSLLFVRDYRVDYLDNLTKISESILILNEEYKKNDKKFKDNNLIIYSNNPRAEYSRILKKIELFKLKNKKILKENYLIGENTTIEEGTIIEGYVVIGNNVKIGKNCIIKSGAKIGDNTIIGENCYIGENTVISGQGIGVLKDENENIYNPLHIGGVIIGNGVEIGPLCNIASGRIEKTVIRDNVIIGGSVYIAHDVEIGRNTLINVGALICGKTIIEENVVIGPHSTVSNRVKIKKDGVVTLGSTVVSKVKSGETVTGNFAVPHKKSLQIMKFLLLKSEE